MDQATWARINDVFHRALDEPPDRRAAFLDQACGGDADFRREVESLLAAHGRADQFIDDAAGQAGQLVASAIARGDASEGQSLGQYRIVRLLGEGGMGIVYLAEDLRLGRLVALKSVGSQHAQSVSRRERLRREARAAAALTHPGIATVYALEEFGDHLYIASEYVPGDTLRTELQRGPLPTAQVIEIGLGLARALAAAHDHGVTHRDLKPENVIRTPGGEVKILDFGLARMKEGSKDSPVLTAEGGVLGTPAYMSPEQIRGDQVDGRSDLFSLGVLLYELTTGVHPFGGSDAPATLARILESEPDRLVNRTRDDPQASLAVVRELDVIVSTCLRKSADARYRSAHELLAALERAREIGLGRVTPSHASGTPSGERARPADALWWWQFHQIALFVAYALLLGLTWLVHTWTPTSTTLAVFSGGMVAMIVALALRWHLWFTLRELPAQLEAQRAASAFWIHAADIVFAATLLGSAWFAAASHVSVALLLIAAAVGTVLSSTVIEPATAREAMGAIRSEARRH